MKQTVCTADQWKARLLILIGAVLYFFVNIQRVAIPGAIFNELQRELNASAPAITGLGAAFMYVYAVTQLFIGMLVDRYGGNRIIAIGAFFFCLGALLFPVSHSLPMLYTARVLTGVGAGSLYLCLIKETMKAFKDNYSVVISIVIMIGFTGGIMANAPFVAISERFGESGFRPVLLVIGVLAVLFYLLFLAVNATVSKPPVRRDIPIDVRRFGAVLTSRHNLFIYTFSGINFGMYYALQTVIGKKFLQDYCAMSSQSSANVLSSMGAVSALSGVAFAVLSKSLGNRRRPFCRLAGTVSLVAYTTLAMLTFLNIRSPWIAGLFLLVSMVGSISSIVIPILNETNEESRSGLAISFMNFGFYMCVAIFGNAVGYLMSLVPPVEVAGSMVYGRGSYLAVFSVMGFFSAVVFACSMRVRETYGCHLKVAEGLEANKSS